MQRKSFLALGAVCGLAFLLAPAPVGAEGVQVAPFYGIRFGGALREATTGKSVDLDPAAAVGATIDVPLPGLPEKLEFLYSHQQTDFSVPSVLTSVKMKIDEWQAGLIRDYHYEPYTPFLAGTLGATHFSFSDSLEDKTLFSVGLGGGVKYFPRENIGLRIDARGYVSFVEGGGSIACSGGCEVHYQGSTFIQGEIVPSVVITF